MTELGETSGESVAEPTGTTAIETAGQSSGQSGSPVQTAVNGTEQDGESFFDYESIRGTPNEAAYKEMQRAFSKKTEALKVSADKISQYDQFMQDPITQMQALARQYGYQMVQGQPETSDGKPKSYENWDQVMEDAERRVMEKMQPMFGELKNMKMQNVEQSLDNSHPDWRIYEDAMTATLKEHPTLVGNPDLLYRMSVPETVMEARANKAALAKIQGTTASATVQGHSTTTQQPSKKPGKLSFNEAVEYAKQEVKRRGLSPPSG